jgi:hypothetical protein
MFCRLLFVLFAIVLPVLLRYTDSDYHLGIFKLFLIDKKVIAISRGHAHLLTSENSKDAISKGRPFNLKGGGV